ncbi:hypothetical protein P9D43_01570 [Neobacillus niacini]|uniref:hypothetical protein n=1 Tax=Neobacillus niacini TaxID=86668 RepID=UPI0007ABD49D|nr:hypothetical protein [Neobacillus niacini]MEC1520719.1 hypothetical protein [Neobacillus niacini]
MIQTIIQIPKGIEVGDSIQKAKDLYGNRYYTRIEQGVTIIGYVDKKHNQSLEFWCDSKNKIILYRLDDNSME